MYKNQKILLSFVCVLGLVGFINFYSYSNNQTSPKPFIDISEIPQTEQTSKIRNDLEKQLKEEQKLLKDLEDAKKRNILNTNEWYNPLEIYENYKEKQKQISSLENEYNILSEKIKKIYNSLKRSKQEYLTQEEYPTDFSDIDIIERIKEEKIDNFIESHPQEEQPEIVNSGSKIVSTLPPFIMPADGPITSPFGYRIHPISGGTKFHSGIDIGVDTGTPIVASNYGIVVYADWYSGFGETVILSHAEGVYTLYAHNSKLLVHTGDKISQGQTIALAGTTGNSTGPHCHFSMWINGALVDPSEHINNSATHD